jgi:hypothetical protein
MLMYHRHKPVDLNQRRKIRRKTTVVKRKLKGRKGDEQTQAKEGRKESKK